MYIYICMYVYICTGKVHTSIDTCVRVNVCVYDYLYALGNQEFVEVCHLIRAFYSNLRVNKIQ